MPGIIRQMALEMGLIGSLYELTENDIAHKACIKLAAKYQDLAGSVYAVLVK